ncbi:MAG: P-loop NTPase [Burkholderiaceae bacterium]
MAALKIIVVSQKGGVGKSTIAANLAAWFRAEAKRSTALIDFDPHGSSSTWVNDARQVGVSASHFPVEDIGARRWLLTCRTHLRRAAESFDVVITDLTWTISMDPEFLLGFDLVLVPSGISEIEVQASMGFIEKNRWVFESLRTVPPTLVICPSRVKQDQLLDHAFNGKNFPVRFVLSPPVYDDADIRSLFRKDFLISKPGQQAQNFRQFAEAILQAAHIHLSRYKDLPSSLEGRRALDNHNTLLTRHMAQRSRSVSGSDIAPQAASPSVAMTGTMPRPPAFAAAPPLQSVVTAPSPTVVPSIPSFTAFGSVATASATAAPAAETPQPTTSGVAPITAPRPAPAISRPPPRTPAFLKLMGGFDQDRSS